MDIVVEKDAKTDVIVEELSTLIEKYKEDIKIISRLPLEFVVHLRPESMHNTSERIFDTSAFLSFRCALDHPFKSPELH
ncbi:hypothetical protein Sjap_024071 [Stephania japonica]|uniref:Uncharacterized protein n=1 Tax=Stephania japonica TaxID=461633 RepID=A0AAP0ELE8_9MAGN